MKNLEENNLIKFKNLTRKKETIMANFKVKGLRKGVEFSASISVDISAAEMHPGETVENIVEHCAKIGIKEFKGAEFEFEGISAL
ncbi:MAG: hypothetical protein S4CHLAM37_00340 [Chlamydiia bacterium]|nr:hypothetical protein [Chlamydiia bacterium]